MISNEDIWSKLVDIHNDFVELNDKIPNHKDDIRDWTDAVHTLQRIICTRELKERCPDWFK